jgi:beta-xylosidase
MRRITSGNPLFSGHYADPESAVFEDQYWIYPTVSAAYEEQTYLDCFSSPDLVVWTKHERIVSTEQIRWAWQTMWAPCCVEKDGRYFLFFGANDIKPGEPGGIGVAVSDSPAGPFLDHIGRPLIDEHHNGAQPIDQFVMQHDGDWYIVYGGWSHCNIARLASDFKSLVPFDDGCIAREITPDNYCEGPYLFKRKGIWYFMWSEGNWGDDTYAIAYAMAGSMWGPWERVGTIIEPNPLAATGAGHHSVLHKPNSDDFYLVYHRREAGVTARHARVSCLDRMTFHADGTIRPIVMTKEGVPRNPL